jgi:hypothetical protein
LFDGVEVWTISWKEDQPCTSCGTCVLYGVRLVAAEIVHHHDVMWSEAWHQNLLDIAEETLAVAGAIKDAWCRTGRNLVRGAGFILGLEPVSKDDSELSPRFKLFLQRRFPSVVCVVENQIQ